MIKVKAERKPQHYTYSWAHINASSTPQALDWLPVSLQEETTDHIRCHHLHRESAPDASLLRATLGSSSSTKAVIVINTENSYQVDPKYFPEEAKWLVPVFIVTSDTGQTIMDTISSHEGEVSAKLDPSTAATTIQNGMGKERAVHMYIICLNFQVLGFTLSARCMQHGQLHWP